MVRPWARGEPPPQGSLSRRLLAIAIDLEGGRRTSAESPRKGIIETYSEIPVDTITKIITRKQSIATIILLRYIHGLLIKRTNRIRKLSSNSNLGKNMILHKHKFFFSEVLYIPRTWILIFHKKRLLSWRYMISCVYVEIFLNHLSISSRACTWYLQQLRWFFFAGQWLYNEAFNNTTQYL